MRSSRSRTSSQLTLHLLGPLTNAITLKRGSSFSRRDLSTYQAPRRQRILYDGDDDDDDDGKNDDDNDNLCGVLYIPNAMSPSIITYRKKRRKLWSQQAGGRQTGKAIRQAGNLKQSSLEGGTAMCIMNSVTGWSFHSEQKL